MSRIAIVGAGVAGLAAARALAGRGDTVVVFEQARVPGGRLATRTIADIERAIGVVDLVFDHGAQYFTVRDQRFAGVVSTWQAQRVVARWSGRIVAFDGEGWAPVDAATERYVGVPGMSAIAAHLAGTLDVRYGERVDVIEPLTREFDRVILAVPPARALVLTAGVGGIAQRITVNMKPCWTVMAAFEQPVTVPFDGAFVSGSPLGWVARNQSKPKRDRTIDTWVLHATSAWSAAHVDDASERVGSFLMEAFDDLSRQGLPRAFHAAAYCWREAVADPPLGIGVIHDTDARVTVCGDWCAGARIEDAYLSGLAAAEIWGRGTP